MEGIQCHIRLNTQNISELKVFFFFSPVVRSKEVSSLITIVMER